MLAFTTAGRQASGPRGLAGLLSWGACGAGFLWAAIDVEHRTWHDLLSHTVLETVRD